MTRPQKTLVMLLGFSVGAIALVVIGVQIHSMRSGDGNGNGEASRQSIPLVDEASLKALPHKSASSADTSHLAQGLVPPTNTWFSGLALQKIPQTVYPMPNSFLAKDTGFELGLPKISSSATEIDGEHMAGITADLAATNYRVARYDKLSADLTYSAADHDLGTLTIIEGSPYIFYRAHASGVITLSDINPSDILEHNDHYIRYSRAGHTYAVSLQNAELTLSGSGASIQVKKDALVTFYTLPGTTDALKRYAQNAVTGVSIGHHQDDATVSTTFNYRTSTGQPTVFVALPYQAVQGTNIAQYQSIWGAMKSTVGTSFTTSTAAMKPSKELDLSKLTATQKTSLETSLRADVAGTTIDKKDSYFAGKQLARAANLLSIAEQLHDTDSANKLKSLLNTAFTARLGTGYFYYDTKLKGIAASEAAFGSEDFNDHHFHYGYWLYAGSIMAKYDSAFLHKHQNQLNLLAADIANYQTSNTFPLYRTYDPYAGHSWAAGLAPFADGNNQESSSEAVHAWNGVSLWGAVTKNADLQQTGQWMLGFEANTAARAWRSVDTSDPTLNKYTSPVASLNFGGKRTYSTFFSAEPMAKLGIQLIPMDPSMMSYERDKATIATSIHASVTNDTYNLPLGDYVLMYLSLSDPAKAADLATKQTVIDDGNSQTYLHAFIDARQHN